MTPRILLSTWRRQGQTFGPVLRDMYGVEVQYAHAVQRAGAHVYLAPRPGARTTATEILAGFDGLLLIGGEDLAAEVSGAPAATIGSNADPGRDRWELALLAAALEADVPVLAVCRGLQLLNVAHGGTLLGDIADTSAEHPRVPDNLADALSYRHQVRLAEGSRTAHALGCINIDVNSLHHQAIGALGDGLVVTGRARDGIVEAVEVSSARWCVGVQWHPELMPGDPAQERLLDQFVSRCRIPSRA